MKTFYFFIMIFRITFKSLIFTFFIYFVMMRINKSLPLKFPHLEQEELFKSTLNEKEVNLVKIMMKNFLKKLKNQCLIRKKN